MNSFEIFCEFYSNANNLVENPPPSFPDNATVWLTTQQHQQQQQQQQYDSDSNFASKHSTADVPAPSELLGKNNHASNAPTLEATIPNYVERGNNFNTFSSSNQILTNRGGGGGVRGCAFLLFRIVRNFIVIYSLFQKFIENERNIYNNSHPLKSQKRRKSIISFACLSFHSSQKLANLC